MDLGLNWGCITDLDLRGGDDVACLSPFGVMFQSEVEMIVYFAWNLGCVDARQRYPSERSWSDTGRYSDIDRRSFDSICYHSHLAAKMI